MKDKLSTRPEQVAQVGQKAMILLFKEPIKRAVKEVLVEEGVVSPQAAERASSATESASWADDESADEGSKLPGPRALLPAVGFLGIGLALRRLNESSVDTEQLRSETRHESDAAMEDDRPGSAGESHSESTGDGDAGGNF